MAAITQRVLDARPDRLDLRDLPYRPPLRSLPREFPSEEDLRNHLPGYVAAGLIRNQGLQGACTGFGLACVANYLFWVRHLADGEKTQFADVSPRMFYELARQYDEWPGTDYEGSSCRGALKGWHKHGVCSEALWPYPLARSGQPKFVSPDARWAEDAASRPLGVYYRIDKSSIVDMQAAIAEIGAIYVSATAHDGWDAVNRADGSVLPAPTSHDESQLPEIAPIREEKSRGGHAFAIVGYNERGFVIQNSWGTTWGASGFAVLPYDDWVASGDDAWACALGVPTRVRPGSASASAVNTQASAWRVGSGASLTSLATGSRDPHNPANDPWPVDHHFNRADYEPWTTPEAYSHTLVTGNDGGVLVPTQFTRDPADTEGLARAIVVDAPLMWLATRPSPVLKVAVYAHGGLNSEEESICRIRVLGPCFEANGIYPLFLTWKTGPIETLRYMLEDWGRRFLGDEAMRSRGLLEELGDAKDRVVEAAAHVLFKGVWSQMRGNAAASVKKGRGLDLLVRQLLALQSAVQAQGRALELHLVGHSAGAILLGHFLSHLARTGGTSLNVAGTTLLAPACSVRFANEHYAGADAAGVVSLAQLHLHVLADANEKADALPSPRVPVYGKSLLYFVSRALDDRRKMPLLGMHRAQLAEYENDDKQWAGGELEQIRRWRQAWPGGALLHVVNEPQVRCTREDGRVPATHGSFDNNIPVIGEVIGRIAGVGVVNDLEWLDYE